MIKRRAGKGSIDELHSPKKRSRLSETGRQSRRTESSSHSGGKRPTGLHDLPVELLYEILLLSINPSFTCVSRHIHFVFKSTRPHFRADYMIRATESLEDRNTYSLRVWWKCKLEIWLRYGICDFEVLQLLMSQTHPPKARNLSYPGVSDCMFELPKRILRSFWSNQTEDQGSRWAREAVAMGFLRYLLSPIELPAPVSVQGSGTKPPSIVTISGNPDSHDGYFLARAAYLDHEPLLDLLLQHGADPLQKLGAAIKFAITRKDERMVRKLISKSRGDRLHFGPVGRELLRYSVKADARDIVNFFVKEQRLVPDLKTVLLT